MMNVNIISESEFTVGGHGVHSAFEDQFGALKTLGSIDILCNSLSRAVVAHAHTIGPVATALLRRSGRRVVTAHLTLDSLVGSISGAQTFHWLISRYLRSIYNYADLVIALNGHHADELRRLGVSKRIEIVANSWPSDILGIPSRRTARDLLALSHDRQVVLTVGQIQPRKAPDAFYACARRAPDKLFIWVGGRPFGLLTAGWTSSEVGTRSVPSNVIHTGAISRRQVYTYYAAADVYFHPSHHELCPVAVLEAAAAGLPLLLRDLPVYRCLLHDQVTRGDEATFTSQIDWILSDRLVSAELSECSRQAVRRYSPAATAEALVALYSQLGR